MSDEDGRRRYFRLDDQVILEWKSVSPEELVAGIERLSQEKEYGQGGELYRIEQKLQTSISQLKNRSPEIAVCLDLMNERIDLFMHKIQAYQNLYGDDKRQKEPEKVSLSATGVAFEALKPPATSQLEVNFFLLPRYVYIRTFGTIVSCELRGELYHVAVNFDVILDEDQETLIQHLLHKQTKIIQAQKAELERMTDSSDDRRDGQKK
ncbi:PilZ domain-containing protein [Piscirickettsia litoralis]|uniref:Pilus assembly protein PilZ n=1 Tax=Piscirickettsia litoralis TaxID=1891921 RepID=A0ABX3A3N2_9GAMM|nr:PilZ domain-containing protein [Piscirickettsia litoralis]ODN42261.1 pilus assembly protein PilZ [Piscirickettsia litoralis]